MSARSFIRFVSFARLRNFLHCETICVWFAKVRILIYFLKWNVFFFVVTLRFAFCAHDVELNRVNFCQGFFFLPDFLYARCPRHCGQHRRFATWIGCVIIKHRQNLHAVYINLAFVGCPEFDCSHQNCYTIFTPINQSREPQNTHTHTSEMQKGECLCLDSFGHQ